MQPRKIRKYIVRIVIFLILTFMMLWDFIPFLSYPSIPLQIKTPASPRLGNGIPPSITPVTVVTPLSSQSEITPLPDDLKPYLLVTTEALDHIGASEYHSFGYFGQDVRIAVIDNQFDGYGERTHSGELPSKTTAVRFGDDGSSTTNILTGRGSHGTACAEIIHDIAPEAEILLVQTDHFLSNIGAVLDYLYAWDVDIVSVSLSVLAYRPGEQANSSTDGPQSLYDTLRHAVQDKGVFIVVSAGNYARQHYQGYFADTNKNSWHEFSEPSHPEVLSEQVTFNLEIDQTVEISLSWSNPDSNSKEIIKSPNTYSVYVYDSDHQEIAKSSAAPPDDRSQYTSLLFTSGSEDTYSIQIKLVGESTNTDLLDLFIKGEPVPLNNFQVADNSLAVPADSQDVFSVAAADAVNFTIDSTSSRGNPSLDYTKPDAVSFAHVSVSSPGYGSRGFSGTSSAAPHVAGMAALILSQPSNHGLTPGELRKQLLSYAEDAGLPGKDNVWGDGMIRLFPLKAICQIIFPTLENPLILNAGRDKLQFEAAVRRSNNQILYGLNASDFNVTIGDVAAAVITKRFIVDQYSIEIHPPLLPSGQYDLHVKVVNADCFLENAIVYTSGPSSMRVSAEPELFQISFSPLKPHVGSILEFIAVLSNSQPITGAVITLDITSPDSYHSYLPLFDDGMHSDGTAEDGIYGNSFINTQRTGRYEIRSHVKGLSPTDKIGQFDKSFVLWIDDIKADTDQDNLPDVWEYSVGLNHQLNDAFNDPDADGLLNIDEYTSGAHPSNWDTDGDSLSDNAEVTGYFATDPNSYDSDMGGLNDADELLQKSNPLDPKDDFTQYGHFYLPKNMRGPIPTYRRADPVLFSDGNVWIGTQHGLVLWNSTTLTYKKYTSYHGLADNHILALAESINGDILIGSNSGLSKASWDEQGQDYYIESYNSSSLLHSPIRAITSQDNGFIWIGTELGVSVFDGTRWNTITEIENFKLTNVLALDTDNENGIWIGMRHGLLRAQITGELSLKLSNDVPPYKHLEGSWITDIFVTNMGKVWVSTWGDGVNVLSGNQWETYSTNDGLADNYVFRIYSSDQNTIWIETRQGLNRYEPTTVGGNWLTYGKRENRLYGIPDGNINTYYVNRNGRNQAVPYSKYPIPEPLILSWWGTKPYFYGIDHISSNTHISDSFMWSFYYTDEPYAPVLSTAINHDGKVWFGMRDGVIIYDPQSEAWQIPGYNHAIPQTQINVINPTPKYIWLGTDGDGLMQFDGKDWLNFDRADGLGSLYVHSLFTDSRERLWIGSGAGLGGVSVWQDGVLSTRGQHSVLSTSFVYSIAEFPDGVMWFGTKNGLSRQQDDSILHDGIQDVLVGQYVWTITRIGSEVWLGSNQGVSLWNGEQWQSYTILDGLNSNQIWDIEIDEDERIWVATSDSINMFGENVWHSYPIPDDVKNTHIWDIAIHPDDNTVWLASEGGILSFNLLPE